MEYHHKSYQMWIERNEPDSVALSAQRDERLPYEPLVSVLLPVIGCVKVSLSESVKSVLSQTYANWELHFISDEDFSEEDLFRTSGKNLRVKIRKVEKGESPEATLNKSMSVACGEYVAVLRGGDTLAPFALFEIAKALNFERTADFIYSDEDKITRDYKIRFNPHFKPCFSPDLLRSYNYISNLIVIRKDLFNKAGGYREGYDGAEQFDLALRATEKAQKIVRLPKVLYHSVSEPRPAGESNKKEPTIENEKRALSDHLKRLGVEGRVEDGLFPQSYRVTYAIKGNPRVSIIIPNRDQAEDLRKCVSSIEGSTYRNFEILIVENGSEESKTFEYYGELKRRDNVRIVEWDKQFNYSAVNNHAATLASGDFLLFLNNDMEAVNHDWVENMLEHAQRREVGVVGAKLYYPFETVQHGGVIIGAKNIALHAHKYFPKDACGYFGRLSVVQNLSAVTGACIMMRKDVFRELGGFDEGYMITASDIDLCLKARKRGYLVVFTPYAELIHHEFKTRGADDTAEKIERCGREEGLFRSRWKELLELGDPYYSPNLSLDYEDFSIREGIKDRMLAEKDMAIAEKDRAIAEKDRAIAEKDRVIAAKDKRIHELLNSMSWKITASLRRFVDLIKK